MKRKPFFSIIIPTYNRSSELKIALRRIIHQKFKDFEIIIVDNSSTDDTSKVVESFQDRRIKYFKNKKNIGWILSIKKGLKLVKGSYVLFQGDDDFMLGYNILTKLFNILVKKKYGFVRLNYCSITEDKKRIFDFKVNKKFSHFSEMLKGKTNEEYFKFIEMVDPFFISGIVIKNDFPRNVKFMNSEIAPWLNLIFYNIAKYGGAFIPEYSFVAKWPTKKKGVLHAYFTLRNGAFTFEKYFESASKILSKEEYESLVQSHTKKIIKIFPVAKYHSSNGYLIEYVKRLVYLYPNLKTSNYLKFWLFISLITPGFVIGLVRRLFLFRLMFLSDLNNDLKLIKKIKQALGTDGKSSILIK